MAILSPEWRKVMHHRAPASLAPRFLIYGTGIRNALNSFPSTTNFVLIYGNHAPEYYVPPLRPAVGPATPDPAPLCPMIDTPPSRAYIFPWVRVLDAFDTVWRSSKAGTRDARRFARGNLGGHADQHALPHRARSRAVARTARRGIHPRIHSLRSPLPGDERG